MIWLILRFGKNPFEIILYVISNESDTCGMNVGKNVEGGGLAISSTLAAFFWRRQLKTRQIWDRTTGWEGYFQFANIEGVAQMSLPTICAIFIVIMLWSYMFRPCILAISRALRVWTKSTVYKATCHRWSDYIRTLYIYIYIYSVCI